MIFGKKSRLERENDALEERIKFLEKEVEAADLYSLQVDRKWMRLLREYRYSQKANCRRKRANRKLRAMLDDVGWPKNDPNPMKKTEVDGKPKKLVPRRLP